MTTWMYARESEAAKKREEAARGGSTAYERAAERASQAIDANLSDDTIARVITNGVPSVAVMVSCWTSRSIG